MSRAHLTNRSSTRIYRYKSCGRFLDSFAHFTCPDGKQWAAYLDIAISLHRLILKVNQTQNSSIKLTLEFPKQFGGH